MLSNIFPDDRIKRCLYRFENAVKSGRARSVSDLFAENAVFRDDLSAQNGFLERAGPIGRRFANFTRHKTGLSIEFNHVSDLGDGQYDVSAVFAWWYGGKKVEHPAPFTLALNELGEIALQHFKVPNTDIA
jgi:hypothetical protein